MKGGLAPQVQEMCTLPGISLGYARSALLHVQLGLPSNKQNKKNRHAIPAHRSDGSGVAAGLHVTCIWLLITSSTVCLELHIVPSSGNNLDHNIFQAAPLALLDRGI